MKRVRKPSSGGLVGLNLKRRKNRKEALWERLLRGEKRDNGTVGLLKFKYKSLLVRQL